MDITNILGYAIILAMAIITGVLAPYIKSKTTAAQQSILLTFIDIAVFAAEQLYPGTGRGVEKKSYVLSWLDDIISWLAKRGFTVNSDKLDAMVESAVYKLKS
jgi:hypothetical protein